VRRPACLLLAAVLAVAVAILGSAAGAAAGGPRLSIQGAVLAPARHPSTVRLVSGAPCGTLLGGGAGQCGVVAAPGGALLYTVDPGPIDVPGLASRPWTVTVYRASSPGQWTAFLQTRPSAGHAGPLFAAVTARTADLTGHGQSLVVGYRSEGTGAFLDIDLVVGTRRGPRVAGHTVLAQGVALVQPRQLVSYHAVYRRGDANCCPSAIQRDVIQARGAAFVVASSRRFPTPQVKIPPSDLG
jgi:hypothetical protein